MDVGTDEKHFNKIRPDMLYVLIEGITCSCIIACYGKEPELLSGVATVTETG